MKSSRDTFFTASGTHMYYSIITPARLLLTHTSGSPLLPPPASAPLLPPSALVLLSSGTSMPAAADGGAIDHAVLLELALTAMDELVKVAQMDEPLWLPSLDGGFETLNYDEYHRAFARVVGQCPAGYVSEATRESGIAIISSVDLVDSLMDAVHTHARTHG